MMSTLEETLNCSGMCTKYKYYLFSDVNSTDDIKKTCKKGLEELILSYGQASYIVLGVVVLYIFINLIVIGC